jgi:RNA-directed DNA polymerase
VTIAQVAKCVGGVLSPLIFNVAMSALDEHLHRPWKPGGSMHTGYLRSRRRVQGLPRWIVRYADDFVVLVHGTQADAENLRADVAQVLPRWACSYPPPRPR